MWQTLDRSRRESRIVWAQRWPRHGSAEPQEHCGRDSGAAVRRKRGGARDGQGSVMEKQGGRWRQSSPEGRRKIKRVESGWVLQKIHLTV